MSRNAYRALIALLPARPLEVGEVLDVVGGVCTIVLPGGGITRARGDAGVGDQVFIRDGVIEGLAPVLPVELIEV